jgi:hypothetical protein
MPRQNDFLDGIQWSKYTKPILPHQMTPAQFREHPLAVHHGTHKGGFRAEELGEGDNNYLSFAGDKFQALDRMSMNSYYDKSGGNIHHYWAVPTAAETKTYYEDDDIHVHASGMPDVHGVAALNIPVNARTLEGQGHALGYYRNIFEGTADKNARGTHENPGSPSVAMLPASPHRGFVTQSQFVEDAIARGKAHEVHPETMDLYKKRELDTTPIEQSYLDREIEGKSRFGGPQFTQPAPSGFASGRPYKVVSTEHRTAETPREELPAFKENKTIDIREVRKQVKAGYTNRVRKTYRSIYTPNNRG